MNKFIIHNGSLIIEKELRISPLNRGMMYGDGCFDTFRSYKGKFFKLEEHFRRLIDSANYLGIETPFGFEDYKSKILELLDASKLLDKDALIRVQCWREGDRGYYSESTQGQWISSCSEISGFKNSISLSTVSTRAIPSEALERKYKLSNGLNYIQAAREATKLGSDDALMLTTSNIVSETTKANIFWVKEEKVFTPSIDCDLLAGITRNSIIELISRTKSLEVIEGRFDLDQIKQSESIFVTNSIRELIPVSTLDSTKFDINNVFIQSIKESFEEYKLQNLL